MENEKELDLLFNNTIEERLIELKEVADPDNEQISTHSMNEKTIIDNIKERVEEFKEYNGLVKEELISSKNSQNALPDELCKEEGVPISTQVTEGIHDADKTDNEELISSHNSDRALPDVDKELTTHTEQIDVISNVNSQRFVSNE